MDGVRTGSRPADGAGPCRRAGRPARRHRPRRRRGHARRLAGAVRRRRPRGRRGRLRDPVARRARRHQRGAGLRAGRGRARRPRGPRPARDGPRPPPDPATSPPSARPSPGRTGTSATSRPSACGRSATSAAAVVHEADWANAWKAHFPVLRIGRRIVIRPTWRRHRRRRTTSSWPWTRAWRSGRASIRRRACASRRSRRWATAACWSTAAVDGGPARVLDVGSGSGILSIAAARLGARDVLAVDIDPIAVEASASNARRNRLARVIRAREGSAPSGEGPFDVVLANLIASLLVTLADGLVADLRAGGTLIASGIFLTREAGRRGGVRGARPGPRQPLGGGRLGGAGASSPSLTRTACVMRDARVS